MGLFLLYTILGNIDVAAICTYLRSLHIFVLCALYIYMRCIHMWYFLSYEGYYHLVSTTLYIFFIYHLCWQLLISLCLHFGFHISTPIFTPASTVCSLFFEMPPYQGLCYLGTHVNVLPIRAVCIHRPHSHKAIKSMSHAGPCVTGMRMHRCCMHHQSGSPIYANLNTVAAQTQPLCSNMTSMLVQVTASTPTWTHPGCF